MREPCSFAGVTAGCACSGGCLQPKTADVHTSGKGFAGGGVAAAGSRTTHGTPMLGMGPVIARETLGKWLPDESEERSARGRSGGIGTDGTDGSVADRLR